MLRKSAQKAFASGDPERRPPDPAPAEASLLAAVEQLFRDLLEALEKAVSAGAEVEGPPLALSRPRPTLDGVEFVLEGPGGRLELTNTLRGFLFLRWFSPRGKGEEILSVQRHGGSYRPIQKHLPPPEAGRRVGFQFTSVAELGKEVLLRARGS
jgi:hypothetical protein